MSERIMASSHIEKLYQEYLNGNRAEGSGSSNRSGKPKAAPNLPDRYQEFEWKVFQVLNELDHCFEQTLELLSDGSYQQKVINILERLDGYVQTVRSGKQANEITMSWYREGDYLPWMPQQGGIS